MKRHSILKLDQAAPEKNFIFKLEKYYLHQWPDSLMSGKTQFRFLFQNQIKAKIPLPYKFQKVLGKGIIVLFFK